MKNLPIFIGTPCGTVAKLTDPVGETYECIRCKVTISKSFTFNGCKLEEDMQKVVDKLTSHDPNLFKAIRVDRIRKGLIYKC
jgi:hypothetical protein